MPTNKSSRHSRLIAFWICIWVSRCWHSISPGLSGWSSGSYPPTLSELVILPIMQHFIGVRSPACKMVCCLHHPSLCSSSSSCSLFICNIKHLCMSILQRERNGFCVFSATSCHLCYEKIWTLWENTRALWVYACGCFNSEEIIRSVEPAEQCVIMKVRSSIPVWNVTLVTSTKVNGLLTRQRCATLWYSRHHDWRLIMLPKPQLQHEILSSTSLSFKTSEGQSATQVDGMGEKLKERWLFPIKRLHLYFFFFFFCFHHTRDFIRRPY